MEEMHHINYNKKFENARRKYKGKSARWLCDKIARLSEQYSAMDKVGLEKVTECSIALMDRLKQLTEDEICLLKGYVYDRYEEDKNYLAAKNVFSLKEMYGM